MLSGTRCRKAVDSATAPRSSASLGAPSRRPPTTRYAQTGRARQQPATAERVRGTAYALDDVAAAGNETLITGRALEAERNFGPWAEELEARCARAVDDALISVTA